MLKQTRATRSRLDKEHEKVLAEIEVGNREVGFLLGLIAVKQDMEGDAEKDAISDVFSSSKLNQWRTAVGGVEKKDMN